MVQKPIAHKEFSMALCKTEFALAIIAVDKKSVDSSVCSA